VWVGKGYHGVHAHTIGTVETAAQQRCVLSIESSMSKGRREGLPKATGGGVLVAATGSHVTSPGRRATA
jgi:hypothetical protein